MKNNTQINHGEKKVIKTFRSRIACDKEKYILKLMADTGLVAGILSEDGLDVTMEYCPGVLVSEIFRTGSRAEVCSAIEKLAEWLVAFGRTAFRKTGEYIALDDINPRNFIFNPETGCITGIDFEAWHKGGKNDNLLYLPAMVKSAYFTDNGIAADACNSAMDIAARLTGISRDCISAAVGGTVSEITRRRQAMAIVRQCDCVIIAGGRSSRMGSPKGLLELDGYTFTDKLIYSAQIFDNIYISANLPEYSRFNCDIIGDIYPDKGPVGALYSSLLKTENDKVFFIPCDTPLITEKTILEFFSQVDIKTNCNILQYNGRIYPTIGLYNKSALPVIKQQIDRDNLKMMSLLNKLDTKYISGGNEYELRNINTIQDYNSLFI